jgi:hypothetical protein
VLLQAVSWTADKTASELRDGSLRTIPITALEPPTDPLPPTAEETVAQVFALIPARHYEWNPQAQTAVTTYGVREDADRACRQVFVLGRDRPDAVPLFVQAARSWMCRKASNDAHDYKFLAAIVEAAGRVSPEWRPHLLAASVHFLHGTQSPDHPVVARAREALASLG